MNYLAKSGLLFCIVLFTVSILLVNQVLTVLSQFGSVIK